MTELLVVLGGQVAGHLRQDRSGRLSFEYESNYQDDGTTTPLSVSMPLPIRSHRGKKLDSWLKNLLPDNERVLDRWATQFQVSSSSTFALLRHVGRDVAGAVQFVAEDDVADFTKGGINWLTDKQVAERLRGLTTNPAAWTPMSNSGQFSLAGAQAKTALRFEAGRWGEPWGAEPTTHILKPPIQDWEHQEINEHLCLVTAQRLGIPAANSEIKKFDDQNAIVVERYDRMWNEKGKLQRIHQEDLCQALGYSPAKKYEHNGGPGAVDVIRLLKRLMGPAEAAVAVDTFVQALALSWVLGGTDAHAKNYGVLLSGRNLALAPLYDVNSILPYLVPELRGLSRGEVSIHTAALAMKVGDRKVLQEVEKRDWNLFAERSGLAEVDVQATVRRVVDDAPQAMNDAANELITSTLSTEQKVFAERLVALVSKQAGLCQSALAGRPIPSRRR